jgi:pimeloyl-ACP methyl ester carboxylesterase
VGHRCSSKPRMAIFLLVPGAWLGGWCWRDVAAHLEADGHKPVGATLTGLGERAHLLSQHIGLHTHISDIVGMVNHRDLNEVVLVGHSYGGMVITGAAEQIPAHTAAWFIWMRPCPAMESPVTTSSAGDGVAASRLRKFGR